MKHHNVTFQDKTIALDNQEFHSLNFAPVDRLTVATHPQC
jgi:hypothetical protein